MVTADTQRVEILDCEHCGRVHQQILMTVEGCRLRSAGASYQLLIGECPVTGRRLEAREQVRLRPSQRAALERKARWIAEGTWRGERSGVK